MLLNRLSGYKDQVLAFMYDFDIPFENNLAERDLRMAKVKQKISGTFRSFTGANAFTRIRGYVSTVSKQGKNALDRIESVFTVKPIDPTLAWRGVPPLFSVHKFNISTLLPIKI